MRILSLKIFIVDNVPRRWLPRIFNAYDLVVRLAMLLSKGSTSLSAIALRVSRRRVSAKDVEILTSSAPTHLCTWNDAFAEYENAHGGHQVQLAWVHKPACGNFGDWLAPYTVHHTAGVAVHHVDLLAARRAEHIISIGSIISYANRYSTVLGAGVNSLHDEIDPEARYLMVRGQFTLDAIPRRARSSEIVCCDPGFFIRELYSPRRRQLRQRKRLLIPHLNHEKLFESIKDESVTLRSAAACRQDHIERLLDDIVNAEQVITSAMHIFVACCAYGVPCALIKPKGTTQKVPGDGIKYRDCMSPVLQSDFVPQAIKITPDIRLADQIDVKLFSVDLDYINKAFELYKFHLMSLLK